MVRGRNTAVVATRVPDSTFTVMKLMAEANNMTVSQMLKPMIMKGLKGAVRKGVNAGDLACEVKEGTHFEKYSPYRCGKFVESLLNEY